MKIASIASHLALRLKSRESRTRNGNAKWNKISDHADHSPSRLSFAIRYQLVSSGRLPAQMIRNCEKLKYAQTIASASINLPMS